MWLQELTSEPAAEYPESAAPLMFIYVLGRDGAIHALRQRAARLAAEISRSGAYRQAITAALAGFPRLFGIEEEYARAVRRAELAWVRTITAALRDGSLPWPALEDVRGEDTGLTHP